MSEILREGEELDVNTDAGFLAALGKAAGRTVDEETLSKVEESDRSVARGLEIAEEESARPGQPRDGETGRFVRQPVEPPAPQEGVALEDEEQDDPIAALLGQYDGDANAALAAAIKERDNAQSLIGRHSAEVGELRERLAKMEGRLEERAAAPAAPAPQITSQDIAWLDEQVAEHGGRDVMGWVIDNAPHLIDAATEAWGRDDRPGAAFEAARFATRLETFETREPQPESRRQEDPTLAEIKMERALGAAIANLRSSMSEGEWEAISPHIPAVLEDANTPDLIKKAVFSDDEKLRQQGFQSLEQLARGRAIAAATQAARKKQEDETKQTKRVVSQVGTGSLRPAEERKPENIEEMSSEERHKLFKERLLGAETTSVADGLTYG